MLHGGRRVLARLNARIGNNRKPSHESDDDFESTGFMPTVPEGGFLKQRSQLPKKIDLSPMEATQIVSKPNTPAARKICGPLLSPLDLTCAQAEEGQGVEEVQSVGYDGDADTQRNDSNKKFDFSKDSEEKGSSPTSIKKSGRKAAHRRRMREKNVKAKSRAEGMERENHMSHTGALLIPEQLSGTDLSGLQSGISCEAGMTLSIPPSHPRRVHKKKHFSSTSPAHRMGAAVPTGFPCAPMPPQSGEAAPPRGKSPKKRRRTSVSCRRRKPKTPRRVSAKLPPPVANRFNSSSGGESIGTTSRQRKASVGSDSGRQRKSSVGSDREREAPVLPALPAFPKPETTTCSDSSSRRSSRRRKVSQGSRTSRGVSSRGQPDMSSVPEAPPRPVRPSSAEARGREFVRVISSIKAEPCALEFLSSADTSQGSGKPAARRRSSIEGSLKGGRDGKLRRSSEARRNSVGSRSAEGPLPSLRDKADTAAEKNKKNKKNKKDKEDKKSEGLLQVPVAVQAEQQRHSGYRPTTTMVLSKLQRKWAEVQFILKNPIASMGDFDRAHKCTSASLEFFARVAKRAEELGVIRGALSRLLLPFGENTHCSDQTRQKTGVDQFKPMRVSASSPSSAASPSNCSRGRTARKKKRVFVPVTETIIGPDGDRLGAAEKEEMTLQAVEMRLLIRMKIADDNDLEAAKSACLELDSFFKMVVAVGNASNEDPHDVLKKIDATLTY